MLTSGSEISIANQTAAGPKTHRFGLSRLDHDCDWYLADKLDLHLRAEDTRRDLNAERAQRRAKRLGHTT